MGCAWHTKPQPCFTPFCFAYHANTVTAEFKVLSLPCFDHATTEHENAVDKDVIRAKPESLTPFEFRRSLGALPPVPLTPGHLEGLLLLHRVAPARCAAAVFLDDPSVCFASTRIHVSALASSLAFSSARGCLGCPSPSRAPLSASVLAASSRRHTQRPKHAQVCAIRCSAARLRAQSLPIV